MIPGARVQPIKVWPGPLTKARRPSQFRAGMENTNRLLTYELVHLAARDVVLQMAVTTGECRRDGWIHARAVPTHPGVILTFWSERTKSQHVYPCDTYHAWQDNVRAIALSLEDLRALDRHGVTKRGEQYAGFSQLPPAGGSTVTMTVGEAAAALAGVVGGDRAMVEAVLNDADEFTATYRTARKRTHPDTAGGSESLWHRVEEAGRVLDVHHAKVNGRHG